MLVLRQLFPGGFIGCRYLPATLYKYLEPSFLFFLCTQFFIIDTWLKVRFSIYQYVKNKAHNFVGYCNDCPASPSSQLEGVEFWPKGCPFGPRSSLHDFAEDMPQISVVFLTSPAAPFFCRFVIARTDANPGIKVLCFLERRHVPATQFNENLNISFCADPWYGLEQLKIFCSNFPALS